MAEIAIEMPSSIRASKLRPRTSPTTRIIASGPQATIAIFFVRSSSCSCSGERVRETSLSIGGDPAHLGAHPGLGDHDRAGAPGDRRVLEQHVGPVAEGDVGTRRARRVLGHRDALAGQGGLLRLERRGLQDASVRRHDVAGLHLHHVPGNEVGRRQEVSCRRASPGPAAPAGWPARRRWPGP